jgi:hypothetical protein
MSASDKLLHELHRASIALLLKRINSGEATAADLAVARSFLRDSNISALPESSPEMMELATKLPVFADDDA